MSNDTDNVIPLRPTPNHVSTNEFATNPYWDLAVSLMHAEAARLLNPETMLGGAWHPDQLPNELEAYIDCNGKRCFRPKGEGERMIRENRQRAYDERQRHLEHVRQEVEALRLDEIDGDWRDHHLTQDSAARFYWRELAEYVDWGGGKPKRVLGKIPACDCQDPFCENHDER